MVLQRSVDGDCGAFAEWLRSPFFAWDSWGIVAWAAVASKTSSLRDFWRADGFFARLVDD